MALHSKHIKAIELLVYHPELNYVEIAKEVGVSRDCLHTWRTENEEFKEALSKACKERWKAAESIAVNAMIKLAAEGNTSAAKYMLDSLGYKPTEKTEVEVKNGIKITIE
jgi:uncharacterized protein YjcR